MVLRGEYMIRPAAFDDIEWIEDTYNELFAHERKHGAFTVFRKGVYPTRMTAEKAVSAGTLYVYDENHSITGSIILDNIQPADYDKICWPHVFAKDEALIIHLLLIRPSMAGRGIASALLQFAVELARKNACKALRLDTGSQNIPAVSLYKKAGFQIVAEDSMKVGAAIDHSRHLFLEKVL